MTQTRQEAVFIDGDIEGVLVYSLKKFHDERGWLTELFRMDEVGESIMPVMSYLSFSKPGILRGPHEHRDQTDFFCFTGPSNFDIRLWDNRPASKTFRRVMSITAGEADPKVVVVPPGVVHAYKNVGYIDGLIINCPNRLFMGEGKTDSIDEIRHEDDPETIFRMDD